MFKKMWFVVLITFLISGQVKAALIVDTGAGSLTGTGSSLNLNQWLAGKFTLTDSYIINSVEGWFGDSGSATSAIYTDVNLGIPATELFSQQFLIDQPSVGNNAWDGAYGLNWALGPGTYWLAFEVRSGDTATAFMPFFSSGAPNPLDDYAFYNVPNGFWISLSSDSAYGMRIDAVPAIPVPAAVWLFGTALLGLVGFSKRRKAA